MDARKFQKESSEEHSRRVAYSIANKTNSFLAYQKTTEEKEHLKRIKAAHKTELKSYYKENLTRKILNLPELIYQID